MFIAPNDLSHSRLGITVTKKVGKANVRNKLKRWSREVYRHHRGPLGLDERAVDFVVNVKPNAADATFAQYEDDFVRLLKKVAAEPRS